MHTTLVLLSCVAFAAAVQVTTVRPTTAAAASKTYKSNFALNFDGKSQFVRVPHHELMNDPLIDSWTLEAWIKANPVQNTSSENTRTICIVGFPLRHPTLEITYDGHAWTQLRDESGAYYTYEGTTKVTDGKWHHIAATWDGTHTRSESDRDKNTLALYVDGKLETPGGPNDDGLPAPKHPHTPTDQHESGFKTANKCPKVGKQKFCEEGMSIGGYYQSGSMGDGNSYTGQFFKGAIDEVRVWQTPLNQTQIKARYKTPLFPKDKDAKDLIFYWPFDDSGLDISPNVVESLVFPWYGLLGNSYGKGKPTFVVSDVPLECAKGSKARACTSQFGNTRTIMGQSAPGAAASPNAIYSRASMAAAVILTMIFTALLAVLITHGVVTGRLNLSNINFSLPFSLPGASYFSSFGGGGGSSFSSGYQDVAKTDDWTTATPPPNHGASSSGTTSYGGV